MPLDFRIQIDTRALQKQMSTLAAKQVPFATARALTWTAQGAVRDLQDEMRKVFDRPNPFTLRAFYAKPATKQDPRAWVGLREFAPGGTPAYQYLGVQAAGGTRPMKKSEKALSALSGGQYWVPGPGAQLDAYGNVSKGQITQILSRLGMMQDPTQNASDRTLARLRKKGMVARGAQTEYFIPREGGNGRPLGIYKLLGPGRVVPVLIFTPKVPHYSVRLPVTDTVGRSVAARFPGFADKAIALAIATAKK